MHVYVYDHDLDLIALTATDGAGRQWTTVMDHHEAHELGDRATRHAAIHLSLDDLRALVVDVTGRDPCH